MVFTALVIVILIASILMIGIVLIQKSKGGGLASNFASSNQIMGVRKTNSFVEKATWTLAVVICVLSILSVFFMDHSNSATKDASRLEVTEQAAPAKAPDFTSAPAAPAAKTEAAPATAETPAEAPAAAPAETPAK